MSPRRSLRALCALLCAVCLLQTVACGTVLHPERRGQSAGRLDADVVILDGVGLLFFLVPGVVAFAVDFATGAIYLPAGERSRVSELFGRVERQRFDPQVDRQALRQRIERAHGAPLAWEKVRTWPLEAELPPHAVARRVALANAALAAGAPAPGVAPGV